MNKKLRNYFDNFEPQPQRLNFSFLIAVIRKNLKKHGFKTVYRKDTRIYGYSSSLTVGPPFNCYIFFDIDNQYFYSFRRGGLHRMPNVTFKANSYKEFLNKMVRYEMVNPVDLHRHLNKKL